MSTILDLIDSAVEHRCSCGCEAPITEDSPSAWYASEACHERAHGREPVELDDWIERWFATTYERFSASMQETGRRITELMEPALARLGRELGRFSVIFDEIRATEQREAWRKREERRTAKAPSVQSRKPTGWRR